MKKTGFKAYPGLILVAVGILIVLYSLYTLLLHGITMSNVALLALGIILMIIGVLFKYTEEIEQVEEKLEHPKSEDMSYWRMQDLEYRMKKVEGEKDKTKIPVAKDEVSDKEFNDFKVLADDMLGKLDQEHIEKFQKSEHFETYEKVMSEDRIDDKLKKKFIKTVDELLEKLPKEEVNKFVKEAEKYSFYQKIIDWSKK